MTLEQFKEKVKNYEICRSADDSIYTDEHMQEMAHEIAMNAMGVIDAQKATVQPLVDVLEELAGYLSQTTWADEIGEAVAAYRKAMGEK